MIISQSVLENRMVGYHEYRISRYKDVLGNAVAYYSEGKVKEALRFAESGYKGCLMGIAGSYEMACRLGSDQKGLEELEKRYKEAVEETNVLYGRFVEWVRNGGKKGGV